MAVSFPISHPKEQGLFQASKWLSYRVLLDPVELEELIEVLPSFSFYNVSEIVTPQTAMISKNTYLNAYRSYVQNIKEGKNVPLEKGVLSSVMSGETDVFYAMEVKGGIILKLLKPTVQISLHHFTFSQEEKDFHYMVHSKNAIEWGLQFSYPQLFSMSNAGNVTEVFKERSFANTELFRTLMSWMRKNSRPTPFLFQGKKINSEARIGNRCFDWIGAYSKLEKHGLSVFQRGSDD